MLRLVCVLAAAVWGLSAAHSKALLSLTVLLLHFDKCAVGKPSGLEAERHHYCDELAEVLSAGWLAGVCVLLLHGEGKRMLAHLLQAVTCTRGQAAVFHATAKSSLSTSCTQEGNETTWTQGFA
ncbi:hypothetical protein FQA47_010469 [Oryzias melastigma]|uniref:Secreted protein n=1 Tax=Oryzias melastigma TaxID=30732 RepID=A0A834BZA2_ORYME|nr:hypothetical protein FQA47_010469 [Oryzias melastigma]